MAHASSLGEYYLGNELFVYTSDSSVASDTSSNVFAYSTECTLSVSANQIDTSNKQSGIWASALPGQLSWNVSTSALYTTANNYKDIFEKFAAREQVWVQFGEVKSLGDAETPMNTHLDGSAGYYTGKAYITSLELNAGNNEVASFSCEFTGDGQLFYKKIN